MADTVPGANADIYRTMEHALNHLSPTYMSTKSKADLEYDYRVTAAKVRGSVDDAITKGMKQIYDAADNEKLKKLQAKLQVQEYDKKVIDEVIDEASEIFRKHRLQAR